MRDERRVLLCPPDTAVPERRVFARKCKDCGRGLWVEAELIGHVDAGSVAPLCIACVHCAVALSGGVDVGVLPGQERDYAKVGIDARAGEVLLRADRRTSAYRVLMDELEKLARDER